MAVDPRAEFAEEFGAALEALGFEAELRFVPTSFSLVEEGDGETRFFELAGPFDAVSGLTGEARAELLLQWANRLLGGLDELPEDFEEARPFLLPSVRPARFFAEFALQLRAEGETRGLMELVPHDTLAGGNLVVFLAFDTPTSARLLDLEQLERWGTTFAEALDVALENLRSNSAGAWRLEPEGYRVGPWEDHYDLSRLLLAELFQGEDLDGAPVVLAVHRQCLGLVGRNDSRAMAALVALGIAIAEEDELASGVLLELEQDGGGPRWVPMTPAPGHPAAALQRHLAQVELQQAYAAQSPLLAGLLAAEGRPDVVVVELQLAEDGGESTAECWLELGAETWLPRADRVVVAVDPQRSDDEVRVSWELLVELLAPHWLQVPGLEPPRYEIPADLPPEVAIELLRRGEPLEALALVPEAD